MAVRKEKAGRQMVPTMWIGIADEELAPETLVPEQFARLWHQSQALTPEQQLAFSVLFEAVLDLRKHRFATRRRQQRLYIDAYRWVASRDREWPFSFENLCVLFGIDPEGAREQLLRFDAAPSPEDGEPAGREETPIERAA